MESALYIGQLRHRRFLPHRHEFSYPVFQSFLDIDRIPELMAASPFTSHNRFNWASYHDLDHLPRTALPPGQVFLLTNLRYLGYVFNPVSFYYAGGEHIAHVNNTFGESHVYHIPRQPGLAVEKDFHVSPFLSMEQEYTFHFSRPGDMLTVHMDVQEAGEKMLDATLTLHRREWNAREIRRALTHFPFHTAKVIAAIHWQALRLWAKGTPFYSHPGRRRVPA